MSDLKIVYQFEMDKTHIQKYELNFNEDSMRLNSDISAPAESDWTRLEHKQCSHCPLNSVSSPHCPIAKNLKSVASHFAGEKSFKEATISVSTRERVYVKKASLQEGLQGIFGLIMATSGCPHMDFLRPMARFHLPFATYVETMVRSISFYLMKQYFLIKDGKQSNLDLKGLEDGYAQVAKVNQGIVERIRGVSKGDADQNAMVILDGFAQLLTMEIKGNMNEVRKALE